MSCDVLLVAGAWGGGLRRLRGRRCRRGTWPRCRRLRRLLGRRPRRGRWGIRSGRGGRLVVVAVGGGGVAVLLGDGVAGGAVGWVAGAVGGGGGAACWAAGVQRLAAGPGVALGWRLGGRRDGIVGCGRRGGVGWRRGWAWAADAWGWAPGRRAGLGWRAWPASGRGSLVPGRRGWRRGASAGVGLGVGFGLGGGCGGGQGFVLVVGEGVVGSWGARMGWVGSLACSDSGVVRRRAATRWLGMSIWTVATSSQRSRMMQWPWRMLLPLAAVLMPRTRVWYGAVCGRPRSSSSESTCSRERRLNANRVVICSTRPGSFRIDAGSWVSRTREAPRARPTRAM